MVKIYIADADMSNVMLLPVTPPTITVTSGVSVRRYETASDGIITDPGYTEPYSITFSSIFPFNYREYSLNSSMFGMDYVNALNRIIKNRGISRVIIVGMDFDRDMIIENFEYSADRGKDIRYTITFKERLNTYDT